MCICTVEHKILVGGNFVNDYHLPIFYPAKLSYCKFAKVSSPKLNLLIRHPTRILCYTVCALFLQAWQLEEYMYIIYILHQLAIDIILTNIRVYTQSQYNAHTYFKATSQSD